MGVILLPPSPRHAKLGEFGSDVLAVNGRTHLLVDVQDPAVRADVERPPGCKRLIFVDNAVRRGNGSRGIAQQRIIGAERLCKRFVGLRGIDARRKIGDVELSNRVATLTE